MGNWKVIALIPAMLLSCFVLAEAAEPKDKERSQGQEIILLEKGGVLLPRGTLVVEPGVQYSHTSRTRISISGFTIFEAIVIGEIVAEDVKRDIVTPFLNLRYGILNDLQFDVKIPWMYRHDKEAFRSGNSEVERTVDDSALGDIDAGLSYHLVKESGYIPDILVNVKAKFDTGKSPYGLKTETFDNRQRLAELPTGSGHYGLSSGVTMVKSSDPAVLFASLGYFYNFERFIGVRNGIDYGEIKPGDSIEFGIGMAYALNEKLSANISYSQRYSFKSEQSGVKIINSDANAASIYFGASHAFTGNTAISFSVGVGLTKDAPDTTVELRVPISF